MKIKLFEELNLPSISFEEACKWISEHYPEDRVIDMFDEEVFGGDWIDREQMEDEEYESEYDYYIDYGNGEAESAVRQNILTDLKDNFNLTFDPYDNDTDLSQFLMEEYDCINK
jgi:hypothetical protein